MELRSHRETAKVSRMCSRPSCLDEPWSVAPDWGCCDTGPSSRGTAALHEKEASYDSVSEDEQPEAGSGILYSRASFTFNISPQNFTVNVCSTT